MKKILFLAGLLLMLSNVSPAQTGALTLTNNTSCLYQITIFAQSPLVMGVTGCTNIGMVIYVPAMTTYSWTDPYDLETSMGGPGSWTYFPSGFNNTVAGTGVSCPSGPGLNSWSGCYPSDWLWVFANVDFHCDDPCAVAGQIGIGCYATGCCVFASTWDPSCTTSNVGWNTTAVWPYDVYITINP